MGLEGFFGLVGFSPWWGRPNEAMVKQPFLLLTKKLGFRPSGYNIDLNTCDLGTEFHKLAAEYDLIPSI